MLRIGEKRQELKLSQDELGKKIGRKQNTISQYEKGTRKPPYPVLHKIAIILNCTIDDLIGKDIK